MITFAEICALVCMTVFIVVIACNLYKRFLTGRFYKVINNSIKYGGSIQLFDGKITLDFDDGIILNSKGKQIKCIYR